MIYTTYSGGNEDAGYSGDFFVRGNFCDMFDCGEYAFAVSNLMHMCLGLFMIIRVDKDLLVETLYDNYRGIGRNWFEYAGRFKRGKDWIIVASGEGKSEQSDKDDEEWEDRTILFRISETGKCDIINEWKTRLSTANSIVVVDDFAYFGQNKLITRLNLNNGQTDFFTNKSDEELAALTTIC